MDSRIQLLQLVEYSQLFGERKNITDVKALIKGIPSETLINYISGYNIHLYLEDREQAVQQCLLSDLLNLMDAADRDSIIKKISDLSIIGTIMWFWSYTNLLFYDAIFSSFDRSPRRDLTSDEALRFFKAYLILNELGNNEINIPSEDFKKVGQENIVDFIVASFMHQRDSMSNLDFRNQIYRGVEFFKWIENHPKYSKSLPIFYNKTALRCHKDLLFTIGSIVIGTNCTSDVHQLRKQVFTIPYDSYPLINVKYLDTLTINDLIGKKESCKKDLRNKCLYKITDGCYYVLNINYLIDHLYKSQVFAFNNISEDDNFLSNKGFEFMESIVFRTLMNDTFRTLVTSFCAKNSEGEELCDYYIRNRNKIGIIEFKDVMINDNAKSSKQIEQVFNELNIKFQKNQKGKPKGITQLINAVVDINLNGVLFDKDSPKDLTIYPIIVYTDNSFGVDGLNCHYNSVFQQDLNSSLIQTNNQIKNVVFINLSYLEMHKEYFSTNRLDLFDMIDEYMDHIRNPEYSITPFEAFSRLYMTEKNVEDLPPPNYLDKIFTILPAPPF